MKNRILHGLWHDHEFPLEGNYTATWVAQNPEAEIWLWPFCEAEKILAANHPHLVTHYEEMKFVVGRSGILRFAILEQYGGIYMDLDIECIKPFGDLFDRDLVLQVCGDNIQYVQDAVMASQPAHPFWGAVLRREGIENARPEHALGAALAWGAAPLLKVITQGKFSYDVRPLVGEYTIHHSKRKWAGKTV